MADPAFGIFDHIERRDEPLRETYEGRLRLLELADAAGFYAYHLAEHHATPLGMAPSPSVFLAAAAQRTRRLRFGPLVYLLPLYHPLRLIEEVCMLDHLSGGRLELGVGRGISPYELAYYDISHLRSRAMFEEALSLLLAGLHQERLTFAGKYYDLADVPIELRPLQEPHPPLWYGASNEAGLRYGAERGMNVVTGGPNAWVKSAAELYHKLREGARGTEQDLNPHVSNAMIGAYRHILVADSDREADEIGRPAYKAYYANITKLWRDFRVQPIAFTGDLDLGRKQDVAIVGSAATVRDCLEQFFQETGCTYLVLSFAWGGLTQAQSCRSLELFTSEVMPHFQTA